MDESKNPVDPGAPQHPLADRLDSWKKIAVYLKRDVSTVQRWERREGMPVHRHLHDKQGSVFAYRKELDAWWEGRRRQLSGDAPPSVTGSPPNEPSLRFRRFRRGGVAVALLLLAATLAGIVIKANSWRNPLASARFSRLSQFDGTEQAATISPNGQFVAFLASRAGRLDAWAGEIGGGAYRNLTEGSRADLSNPSIRTLGFSPDSSLVSIWTRSGDGTQPRDVSIYAAPLAGGPLRPYLQDAAEYDWSKDGRRLVYHTTAPGDPLFVRERDAIASRQIFASTAGSHCHYPLWSPDGAFIYFLRGVPPNNWDLWRIRPSGADLEQLTHQNAHLAYPVMLDQRTLVYLATDPDGSGPWIYGLDVEHPAPHRLTTGVETYTSLAASADGLRLIATTANPRSSLWRVRLDPGKANAGGQALITANALSPRLGPGFLLFLSSRTGGQGIWTMAGGTTREIWHDPRLRITGSPTVSPDGNRIAFTVGDGTHTRLLAMDKDGAHLNVLTEGLTLQGNPAWSPDGRSIVSAVVYNGEPRLTRIFLNGEAPLAMLSEYSVDPVWSPDGRFLVYSGPDIGTTLPVRAAAADGRPFAIPSLMLTRGARRLAILSNPPALVVLRGDIGHKDLWAVNLQGGGERQLTQLPANFSVNDFDIASDGSELILDKIESNSDMVLIERRRTALTF